VFFFFTVRMVVDTSTSMRREVSDRLDSEQDRCTSQTLNEWVKKAERTAGHKPCRRAIWQPGLKAPRRGTGASSGQ